MIPKRCKTPLRYPGGKSRATDKIFKYLPHMSGIKKYHEAFLGGGSMALKFSRLYPNIPVWVNDKYWNLYNFWMTLKDHGSELSDIVMKYRRSHPDMSSAKDLFLESKSILVDGKVSEMELAARFYITNKCSFSGLGESSSFSKKASVGNFSEKGIENLKLYPFLMRNWTITNEDYSELLTDDSDTFVYLDPPYDIGDSLYGRKGDMHKGFDHYEFAKKCNKYSAPTMISYNYDNWVVERFGGWNDISFDLTYTMRSTGTYNKDQKKRKELLLLNYHTDKYIASF